MPSLLPLEADIRRRIAAAGPMPIAEYMALCLTDPEHGYYSTRDPFGTRGDFITAPEVSQMFGEMLGLWSAITWQMMGAPDQVLLVELGPGRGTLMADLLRASRALEQFEAFCVVTQSVRAGIPISVDVCDVNGAVLEDVETGF